MNTSHLSRDSFARLRDIIRKRDKEVCQYCNEYALNGDVDHILPLTQGGTDSFDNLVWSCQSCNRTKSGKMLRDLLRDSYDLGYKKGLADRQRKSQVAIVKSTTAGRPRMLTEFSERATMMESWLADFLIPYGPKGCSCKLIKRVAIRDGIVNRNPLEGGIQDWSYMRFVVSRSKKIESVRRGIWCVATVAEQRTTTTTTAPKEKSGNET